MVIDTAFVVGGPQTPKDPGFGVFSPFACCSCPPFGPKTQRRRAARSQPPNQPKSSIWAGSQTPRSPLGRMVAIGAGTRATTAIVAHHAEGVQGPAAPPAAARGASFRTFYLHWRWSGLGLSPPLSLLPSPPGGGAVPASAPLLSGSGRAGAGPRATAEALIGHRGAARHSGLICSPSASAP